MEKIEKEKEIEKKDAKINSFIGTINAIQEFSENDLNSEEYKDLCDAASIVTVYLRLIKQKNK